jgi:hypothetical protein
MNDLTTEDYYTSRLNNPFLRALPSLPSNEELKRLIGSQRPAPDEKVRGFPAAERLRLLSELRTLHIPLGRDVELMHYVYDQLHDRYSSCIPNPKRVEGQRGRVDAFIRRALARDTEGDFEATGSALIAPSACGKSRCLKRILRLIPQTVDMDIAKDPGLPPKIVVWIRVECPSNRKVSALITAIIDAIELALCEKIDEDIRGGNISQNVSAIGQICEDCCLGILVLDEIQHVLNKHRKPEPEIMNFLVALGNTLGVPIMLVGTPLAQRVVGNQMRQARRMIGPTWTALSHGSKPWNDFIGGIHPFQFTENLAPVEFLSDSLYRCSQGLPGIAILVFRYSQRYAILSGESCINTGVVDAVVDDLFEIIKPMIAALASGDKSHIEIFDDLSLVDDLLNEDSIHELVEERRRVREKLLKAAASAGVKGAKMITDQITRDALKIARQVNLSQDELTAVGRAKKSGKEPGDVLAESVKKKDSV